MFIRKLFDMNLQLHAGKDDDDEEEINDEGFAGEEEDPEDSEDKDDKDPDEEEDPDDKDSEEDPDEDKDDEDLEDEKKKKPGKKPAEKADKVTAALIEQKRLNKELNRKLQAIEDKNTEEAEKKANEQRIQDLIKDGYGEAQAKQIVESDAKTNKLEREIQKLKFEKLEAKNPGISGHMDEILNLVKKSNGALTIEEIYNAKFRSTSEYDIRTNAEAATLHKQKTAQQKKGTEASGGGPDKKPVKLSPSDERVYQYLTKKNKSLTRAQFAKTLKSGEIEE